MTVLMIACSRKAYETQGRLKDIWEKKNPDLTIVNKVKCSSLPEYTMKESVAECVAEWFYKVDAVLFFSATGIAVRSIAGLLQHKSKDPAVLVIDEQGIFCISLLSGHMGGANALTEEVSRMLGAMPVITTATDGEGKFSVDTFARKWGLQIADWDMAKHISAAVLCDMPIGWYVNPACGTGWIQNVCKGLPDEIHVYAKKPDKSKNPAVEQYGVYVSFLKETKPCFPQQLTLIPKQLVLGIGCKKGSTKECIEEAVSAYLEEAAIFSEAISGVATIDLKKDEPGLLAFCGENGYTLQTFSTEELQKVPGQFSGSDFVKEITGVDNVCERSAVLATDGGHLLGRKRAYHGVTISVAVRGCQTKSKE